MLRFDDEGDEDGDVYDFLYGVGHFGTRDVVFLTEGGLDVVKYGFGGFFLRGTIEVSHHGEDTCAVVFYFHDIAVHSAHRVYCVDGDIGLHTDVVGEEGNENGEDGHDKDDEVGGPIVIVDIYVDAASGGDAGKDKDKEVGLYDIFVFPDFHSGGYFVSGANLVIIG